ncbi:BRCT domain-containing protein [Yimella lutea]|uniref:BRCT domain-containing protein n=1 Tax=Yimella lutea TaxID=587872 RepID=UPI001151217D|nr:BRCT domain-containing protein [Yimella lutea]
MDELATVDKIGTVKAAMIVDELAELANVIDRMSAAGVVMQDVPASTVTTDAGSQPLAGLSVCVTGKMVGPLADLSRGGVNGLIEANGGRAVSGVGKDTSLLVANVDARGSSKAKNALKYGLHVVSEDEFAAMLGMGASTSWVSNEGCRTVPE